MKIIKKYITSLVLFFFFAYMTSDYMQIMVYAVEDNRTPVGQTIQSGNITNNIQKKKQKLTTKAEKKSKKYKHTSQTELQIAGDGKKTKKFRAKIQKDTEFRSGNGSDFLPSDISLSEGSERFIGGYGFDFGISGTHLIFSQPIQMEMEVNAPEGDMYEILVKHEGDAKYNTSGLSVYPGGNCDSQGHHSNPGNYTKVKNGKVVFYTCGASSYTMNPTGGTSGSNDVRWIIGDYGQVQVYYNGLAQVYGGNPPTNGGGAPSVWPRLRVGATNVGNGGTAWTTYNTTSSQIGNTYYTTNTLTYVTAGRTFTLVLNWEYTAPEKFLTWSYNLTIPSGNTDPVKFYYGQDSYVAGGDANDVGYYTTSPTQTVGIYDNSANVLSAQRYISGETWDGYIATGYGTVQTQTNGGNNYTNVITGSGDNGYGINWDFGSTPGTYTSTTEWRVLPYVSAPVPDVIPGIAQPSPGLQVGVTSQIPLGVTNAGNADSTGVHTMVLTLPVGIIGPASSFTSNSWSCGAQVGSTVTCTKTMNLASLASDDFFIPVTPDPITENQTLNFSVSLSNASDSNTGNNTASVLMQIAVGPSPNDFTPPSIGNHFPTDNMVLPIGNFNFMFEHSDEEGEINLASHDLILQKWNGVSWGADISGTYLGTATVNSSGAVYPVNNLPYGKYKAAYQIGDNAGLTSIQEITFYVDALEFTINTGSVNIGDIPSGSNYFGTEELTVTIKTVGVPFQLTMLQDSNMIYNVTEIIPNWDGAKGFGYEQEPYAGNISNIGTGVLVANQGHNINTNGEKNTYTYKIKYGANIDIEQSPGEYSSLVSFRIQTSYTQPPSICQFDETFFGCNL